MLDRQSYKFKNGKFMDLSGSELAEKLPPNMSASEVTAALSEKLRNKSEHQYISFDSQGVWFKAEDDSWQQIISFQISQPDDLPAGLAYNYQFKADPGSKANSSKVFAYDAKLNTSNTDEAETVSHMPASLTLRQLLEVLLGRFKVDKEDLLSVLERIELGTFQIDLVKSESKLGYRLVRLFQAQAMSFREQRRSQLEIDHEKQVAEIARLIKQISNLESTIVGLRGQLSDMPRLSDIERQYQELCERLNIKPDSDLGFYGLASLRKQIGEHFNSRLLPGFMAILKGLSIHTDDAGSAHDKLTKAFVGYLNSQEDSAVLEPLKNVALPDLAKVSPVLDEEFRRIIADTILYHFSALARRELPLIQGLSDKLRDYDLTFFHFQPGDPVSATSCRYVSVRETDYPRGACVETIVAGIKRLSTDTVIYKADVIIST